jgi:hypothetical protein
VDSKITDYTSFILESQTQVTCNRVRFEKSVNVNNAKGGKFIAEDCQFRLLADFTGGTLWIDKCVFVEKTNLWNRCSGHFFDNVFYRELSYNNNSSATNPQWGVPGTAPLIHGNSFLGKNAVTFSKWWGSNPPTPIPIGPNYYGDYYSPAWGYNSQWKFLEGRGASIVETANNVKIFDVSRNFIRTGPQRKDPDVFPEFWVAGYVIGQMWSATKTISERQRLSMFRFRDARRCYAWTLSRRMKKWRAHECMWIGWAKPSIQWKRMQMGE